MSTRPDLPPTAATAPAPSAPQALNPDDILYHLTVATKPTDLVETPAGQVPYSDWVEAERRRIIRKGNWSRAEHAIRIYANPDTGELSLVHLRLKDL